MNSKGIVVLDIVIAIALWIGHLAHLNISFRFVSFRCFVSPHPSAPDSRAPNKTRIPARTPKKTPPSSNPGVKRIISASLEVVHASRTSDPSSASASISTSVPGETAMGEEENDDDDDDDDAIASFPPRIASEPLPSRTYRTRDDPGFTVSVHDPVLLCWGHSRMPRVSHSAWDGTETLGETTAREVVEAGMQVGENRWRHAP